MSTLLYFAFKVQDRVSKLAIGNIIRDADLLLSGDRRRTAWVTQYSLSYSNSTSFLGEWYDIINPETGSILFTGVKDYENRNAISYFEPVLVNFLRIFPKTWYRGLVLRWTVIFCSRAYFYPPPNDFEI